MTLVAYGAMVPVCERAADALAGEASVEVLDLRSLRPLDEDALLASAAKTGRVVIVQEAPRTAGFGAELAAILAEKAILDLHGPVLRVTGFDVPYPYWRSRTRTCRRSPASRRPPKAPRVLSVYLDSASAGLDWLPDPASPELRRIVAEAEARTPETPCDAGALARDAEQFLRLVEERHFGVATGVVDRRPRRSTAWERQLSPAGPRTWGEAVTGLQLELREALRDEHVHLFGAPSSATGVPTRPGRPWRRRSLTASSFSTYAG